MAAGLLGSRASGAALIAALLVAWELSARFLTESPNWPPFSEVAVALVAGLASGELGAVFASSLYRLAAGFLFGSLAGVAVGLAMGAVPFVRRALEPLVEILRPLPVPGIIPPLILLLGIDDAMKIFVVAFATFFPVAINTAQGVRAVDPTLLATARTFRKGRVATLLGVVLPASLPFIFAGLRVSLALALIVTVVAEMISGSEGIGYYILQMQYAMQSAAMYAAIVVIALAGYLLNRSFLMIERRVLRWYLAPCE